MGARSGTLGFALDVRSSGARASTTCSSSASATAAACSAGTSPPSTGPDRASGAVRRLTDNADGYLRSYVYFEGRPSRGLGLVSPCLHALSGNLYYFQGNEVRVVSARSGAGALRRPLLALVPLRFVALTLLRPRLGRPAAGPTSWAAEFGSSPSRARAQLSEVREELGSPTAPRHHTAG